jgi:hypothetical protein
VKKKILKDHNLRNKTLVSPMNEFLSKGTFNSTPYIYLILPELLWQAILNDKLGVKYASNISLDLIKDLEEDKNSLPLCFISNFAKLNNNRVESIIHNTHYAKMLNELKVLVRIFPECPLKILFDDNPEEYTLEDITYLKKILNPLLNRTSRESICAMTNLIYYIFETNRLTVQKDSTLLKINEITFYPDTDLSKLVASSVRATLNLFAGNENFLNRDCEWSKYFWNRAYSLEPDSVNNLYFKNERRD